MIAYHTILADPPWEERGGGKICRGAQRHYPLMKVPEIIGYLRQIPVAQDAHLYLWVTNNHLQDGLRVMEALGFVYKTNLVWVKTKNGGETVQIGLGQYFRGAHELLLFGTRGRQPYRTTVAGGRVTIPSVILSARREHSRKPDEQYTIAEAVSYPPYIEAFARERRDGWDAIGNEAPGAIELSWLNTTAQNGQPTLGDPSRSQTSLENFNAP